MRSAAWRTHFGKHALQRHRLWVGDVWHQCKPIELAIAVRLLNLRAADAFASIDEVNIG